MIAQAWRSLSRPVWEFRTKVDKFLFLCRKETQIPFLHKTRHSRDYVSPTENLPPKATAAKPTQLPRPLVRNQQEFMGGGGDEGTPSGGDKIKHF